MATPQEKALRVRLFFETKWRRRRSDTFIFNGSHQLVAVSSVDKRSSYLSRDGPLAWPPRSKDIAPQDFFLWGYVMDKVMLPRLQELYILRLRSGMSSQ
jgi:hypothetical protein